MPSARWTVLVIAVMFATAITIGVAFALRFVDEPAGRLGPRSRGGSDALPAPTLAPAVPRCTPDPSLGQPARSAPADLDRALGTFLADPRVTDQAVSVSVWIDGYGEVLTHDPDRMLDPASNQKLLTAMGALAVIGPTFRFTTELRLTPNSDLVVVGGGDPTLRATGAHSLSALAARARSSGRVHNVARLLVDESHHDGARRAGGWQDWQIPAYTGPLSALMVDDNRWRRDAAFLADPALANGELLARTLSTEGITVRNGVEYGAAPPRSVVIASVESAPVSVLITDMLRRSDNPIADQLLKEVGRVGTGTPSLAAGGSAARHALERLCIDLVGQDDDGSGLSRANGRSAREWRVLLQAARGARWWPILYGALPVAGQTGTLAGRLRGTAATGNVRAKTGTIIGGAALSGYGATADGRAFVFSVIVNGADAEAAAPAIDQMVVAIATYNG